MIAQLVEWKERTNRKPLIIKGARQVGKTWLLRHFGECYFTKTHYFNFEADQRLGELFQQDLNPQRILNELQFYLGEEMDPQNDLIIFDEIQQAPEALTSLKYFQEERSEIAICAAGSLLGIHLSSHSFPVGKVEFMNLYPLTFIEFLNGIEADQLIELINNHDLTTPLPEMAHQRLWELWKHYLVVGGLPEVINSYRENPDNLFVAMESARTEQQNLLNGYMVDIAKHSGKSNALQIETLWLNVVNQLAREQDGGAAKFRFRDAIPGVRGYDRLQSPIDWLTEAHLILRTSIISQPSTPLSAQAKENSFKLYLFDSGLLGAMSGMDATTILHYNFGSYQGYVAENFVAQELRAAGVERLYSWQRRTSEIEFIVENRGDAIPIEVKSGRNTRAKSLAVYEGKYQPDNIIILSAKNSHLIGNRHYLPIYLAGLCLETSLPIF
ncbi:MAG: ATP-binding protein [Thiotrichales bacterium]|jgi:predicted AAA+ superfamily ATPase|nr:ATP-binding protein [Thiotrichales bacterium]MBT3613628.1 ATP-binding protein [Thiotrichales bacterium]MBT3753200.1 ATP-binding protein [Thiotrichales bacterium]MBT4261680.1 ATP-binding protein [Thiotrichales bacterium]MBT4972324.1 ATP-binding protein [Thiotrichales bacterium]